MEGKRGNYIALAVTLSALGALLLCSQAALESARAGLNLCAQMIVPSLLPFFILSSLLQQLGLPGILGRWLSPVTQKLFGIGGAGASALLLGVTGGYPLGADAVARLRRSGALTRLQPEGGPACCKNSGPAFVVGAAKVGVFTTTGRNTARWPTFLVGAAGVGVFHSAGYGLLLYGVHVLSAVIVGMLFAPRSGGFLPEDRSQIAAVSLSQALPEAVRSAVRAVLTVSGFVVTFSVMTGVLDASGLLPALVGTSAARLGLELHFTRALCTGVLELGTGIGAMQGLMPTPGNLALAAFLIGWGGVSVHCQTAAVIAGTDIKSARHTVGRLLHGAISALCMWVLASLALFS